jgi:hypothetical protein
MTRLISTLIMLFMSTSSPLAAETGNISLPNIFESRELQFQPTAADLSPESYEYATHRNQRLLGKAMMGFMDSMGSAGDALKYTGVAAYMAIKGVRLDLNDDKTMGIELNDMADSDREIQYNFHISW